MADWYERQKISRKEKYEEVTKYNEEHGTNYSYGYYKALKFRGLI